MNMSDILPGLLIMAVSLAIYLVPALIAFRRGHHQRVPILLFNLFFGWTLIGWIAALIWCSFPVKKPT